MQLGQYITVFQAAQGGKAQSCQEGCKSFQCQGRLTVITSSSRYVVRKDSNYLGKIPLFLCSKADANRIAVSHKSPFMSFTAIRSISPLLRRALFHPQYSSFSLSLFSSMLQCSLEKQPYSCRLDFSTAIPRRKATRCEKRGMAREVRGPQAACLVLPFHPPPIPTK